MSYLLEVFRNTSPISYLMLLLFLVGLISLPIQAGLGLAQKRLFAPLWWLLPTLLILLALFSTTFGALQTSEAIQYASPNTKNLLAITGLSLSKQGGALGLALASALLAFSALAAALGPGIRPKGTTHTTLAQAATTAILSVLTFLGGFAWFILHHAGPPLAALCVFFGGLGLTLLSLRFPDDEQDAQHAASSRLLVASLWIGAMICAAYAQSWWAQAEGFSALSRASPDTRQKLFYVAMDITSKAFQGGMLMTLATLLAATFPVLATLRASIHKRAIVNATITLVLFFTIAVGTAVTTWALHSIPADTEALLKQANVPNENEEVQ